MLMQTQSRAVIRLNANSTRPAPAPGGLGTLELMASRMTFGPNDEIFGEDEPAEYAYKVVAGAVRTYKILKDGRRKIGAFYLPGDMFGLEAGGNHQFSAQAIDNATVLVIRRSAVISLAECDTCVARELWSLARRELHGVQEHMLLLAKSAQQRVASFLL